MILISLTDTFQQHITANAIGLIRLVEIGHTGFQLDHRQIAFQLNQDTIQSSIDAPFDGLVWNKRTLELATNALGYYLEEGLGCFKEIVAIRCKPELR